MTVARGLRPYFKIRKFARHDAGQGPWDVLSLCSAYRWPTGLAGGGKIGIVELGGSWTQSDVQAFCARYSIPVPTIANVSVDGTQPASSDADGEVALDIQVALGAYFAATGKAPQITIYWASDIAPAIRAAIKDGCAVCSISWGADESQWGAQAALDLQNAAQEAVNAGMVVFAASGDNDSSDGDTTPANVDLPAAAPSVVGCGGTTKTPSSEVVWNNNPGQSNGEGTGGGYSTIFAMPAWQLAAPANSSGKGGRLVPDVAANADPNTGYSVIINGSWTVVGGTSAVAPLYAGLFAAFGAPKTRFVTPQMWANPSEFVDITSGDNGMYKAQVGPDACTGLGAPIGTQLAAQFVTASPSPAPRPPDPVLPPLPTPVPPLPPTAPAGGPTLAQAQAAVTTALAALLGWSS